jgi:hypothetical protein
VNISSFSHTNQVILTALKHYGMIVADNGSSWYISGAPDNRWNNDDLHALGTIPGSDFEVIDESSLQVSANSGQAAGSTPITSTPTITHSTTAISISPHSPTSALTPQITQLVNKKNSNANNSSPGADGSRNMLPILLGSVVALLTIIVARSRFVLTRRSRKRKKSYTSGPGKWEESTP